MEVVKFGNLIKSPPGIIRVDDNPWPRKWENRYFELVKYNSGEFTWNYFQNESKEKVKKSIEMKDVLKVVDNVQSKNHKHVFCVVTETRKYFFSAPSATASTNWQLALMKGCPHLSEGTVCNGSVSFVVTRANTRCIRYFFYTPDTITISLPSQYRFDQEFAPSSAMTPCIAIDFFVRASSAHS